MDHPSLTRFSDQMKALFDSVDDELEVRYGDRYPLHPNRPKRGTTANSAADGLFNVGAYFTPGYGSEYGRGYVVDVEMATLASVPADVREEIEEEVVRMVRERLPKYFPERRLDVERDGRLYKILGDLGLGLA